MSITAAQPATTPIPCSQNMRTGLSISVSNPVLDPTPSSNNRPVCRTDVRGEQRCLSLSHLWRLTVARVFDKLVGIFLATSDEKSKPLPVVLFLGVYSDGYE